MPASDGTATSNSASDATQDWSSRYGQHVEASRQNAPIGTSLTTGRPEGLLEWSPLSHPSVRGERADGLRRLDDSCR